MRASNPAEYKVVITDVSFPSYTDRSCENCSTLLVRPGWSCPDQEIVPYSLAAVEATLVVAYNTTTHQTFGVCVDISDENIDRLIHRLELSQNFASNPLLVLVVLESFVARFLQHRTAKTYNFYSDQEEHMHIDKEHKRDSKRYKSWSREDDSSTSQRLTEVAIVTAELDAGITSLSRILDCVERGLQALSKAFNLSSNTETQEQLNFLRQRLASTHSYISQTRENVQFLVQLVSSRSPLFLPYCLNYSSIIVGVCSPTARG
jgi:hypothetical protein